MRIIGIDKLRELFLDILDNSRYALEQDNENAVKDLKFGTNPDANYYDRIFTEYGLYNEEIIQTPADEELITPGIFTFDGADIVNNPSYDCYNEMVAFEFLGFESQREALRLLLEKFAGDIRGKTFNAWYDDHFDVLYYGDNIPEDTSKLYPLTCIISTDMPVLSDTFQQSGYDRFQAYINIDFTVLYDIDYNDDSSFKIDGEILPVSGLEISRTKTMKAFNVRNLETQSYGENQAITIAISGLFKNSSEVCNKIKRGILSNEYLNESYEIEYSGYKYKMFLNNGSINAVPGTSTTFSAAFSTLYEV